MRKAQQKVLKREVNGRKLSTDYVEYHKIEDLSVNEINKLKINGEYLNGIVNGEWGVVEYYVNDSTVKSKRELYILSYNTGLYRYISPVVNVGETLTASYYNAIFDSGNYLNSTVTVARTNNEISVYKFGVNSIYRSVNNDEDNSGESISLSATNYVYYKNDIMYSYYNYGDKWGFDYRRVVDMVCGNVRDFDFANVISEYLDEILYYYMPFSALDHSYFVKTSTGFSLRKDMVSGISSGNAPSGNVSSGSINYSGNSIDSGELGNVTLDVVIKDDIIAEVIIDSDNVSSKVLIFDIGATKISLPKEFLDKIKSIN